MDNKKFNGWSNWDTWNLNLWLTGNDEPTYRAYIDIVRTSNVFTFKGLVLTLGIKGDDIDYRHIDWEEIYEHGKEELDA